MIYSDLAEESAVAFLSTQVRDIEMKHRTYQRISRQASQARMPNWLPIPNQRCRRQHSPLFVATVASTPTLVTKLLTLLTLRTCLSASLSHSPNSSSLSTSSSYLLVLRFLPPVPFHLPLPGRLAPHLCQWWQIFIMQQPPILPIPSYISIAQYPSWAWLIV